jgi:DNA modification methylase
MTLYNEDCLETMARLGNASIDCVITSPPYDNLRSYNGYCFDFETISKELTRIIKPNGVIVWVVGDQTINGSESGSSFRQALRFIELGLNLHDTMIYEKNSSTFPARSDSNRYTQIYEYMFVLSKGKPNAKLICDKPNKWAGFRDYSGKLKNPVPHYSPRTNIWRYVTSKNSTGHPAPFPLELVTDHLQTWTNEGDLVYDPFIGSGTTAIACEAHNRKWIGSEISNDYCEIVRNRTNHWQEKYICTSP